MRGVLPTSSLGGSSSISPKGDWFRELSVKTAYASGRPITFAAATVTVLIWVITGPIFRYSDTWQLVINTGTTIVTFLMVFLIQATQNRDTAAIQLKLDELILATKKARNGMIAAEDLSDEQLELIKEEIKVRSAKGGTSKMKADASDARSRP